MLSVVRDFHGGADARTPTSLVNTVKNLNLTSKGNLAYHFYDSVKSSPEMCLLILERGTEGGGRNIM